MSIREEQTGQFFIADNDESTIEAFNNTQDNANLDELLRQEQIKQEMWEGKEIMPLGGYVMVLPYTENPYVRKVNEIGLLVNGRDFKSTDSGKMEQLDEFYGCAQVIEVGPQVSQLQPGDEVIIYKDGLTPLPFMDYGFYLARETSVLAVINKSEVLQQRFKHGNDK